MQSERQVHIGAIEKFVLFFAWSFERIGHFYINLQLII